MLDLVFNKDLTQYNTLGFYACAEYFLVVKHPDQLARAVAFAKREKMPLQVLSGGSNLLMSQHVPGLTLHIQIAGMEVLCENQAQLSLRVGAGENWHKLVEHCVHNNWQGLENLALIPGLVGASPVQNIGAYGSEVADVITRVSAFDCFNEQFVELTNSQCEFSYRDSLFKRQPGRYIINAVTFALSKRVELAIKYQALQSYVDQNCSGEVGLRQIFDAVCAIRNSKLPDPQKVANVGSFFKNPCVSKAHFEKLRSQFSDIVGFEVSDSEVKIAAGWMIDNCGWKGHKEQGVGVYHKQALVLIHDGGATLAALLQLAEKIQRSVFEKFAVELEIEPQTFP